MRSYAQSDAHHYNISALLPRPVPFSLRSATKQAKGKRAQMHPLDDFLFIDFRRRGTLAFRLGSERTPDCR